MNGCGGCQCGGPSRPPSARGLLVVIVLVAGLLTGLVVRQPASADAVGVSGKAGKAVAYALAQQGKPYRWGAEGPGAFDCSGLMQAAWRRAGISIPRTAAGQLAGLPKVRVPKPGDLVIYPSSGPSRRHVAMVVGGGRMVEAPRSGVPVRVAQLRDGWLGVVRPGGG